MGKIKFGTDGWRAIIDEEFTFDNVKIVAQAVADYVNSVKDKNEQRNKELVVGYDSRRNSKEYADAVSCVLAANSIKVFLTDRITSTPAVSFAIKNRNLTGGVIITASHNPPAYNGMKYKAYYSGSADMDITGKIEKLLYKSGVKEMPLGEAKAKNLIEMTDAMPAQLEFVKNYVNMAELKKAGFKILADSMYGTGGRYLEGVLKDTNCSVRTIHAEPDPDFGGVNPEPVENNLKELMAMTKEGRYDIGIATDGDGDRVACATPEGKLVNGQNVMALLLWHFAQDRKMKGSVVTTVCGTVLLSKICERYGLRLQETPVGFKYICDIMRKEDVLIGGEETGGIGFKNYIPERDGILSGLLLLEMMAHRKKPILEIIDDMRKQFGSYCYLRESVEFGEEKKKGFMPRLSKMRLASVLGKKVVGVNTLDGVRFLCEDGSWMLFRLSGTEPILRIYSEASSEERSREILRFAKGLALKF